MFAVIFYGGIVVAFLIVLIEYRCAKSNKKFYKSSNTQWWNRIYKWRYLVAFLLVPIVLLEYPIFVDGEHYKIFGFPLIGAVFDSKGTDFISAMTGIFLFIDAVVWYFSIHIFLCVLQRWSKGTINET